MVGRIADLLPAGGRGVDVEIAGKSGLIYHVLKNKLSHGAAADIAVADEKYFYHIRISPYMLVFLDFTGFPAFPHLRGTCVFWHMSAGFSSEKL